ncbi:MAG TPA: ABC transporter permease [Vicinamibacterales bacterium]|nr:ABC transporter permease [Vicinamibacterales bacterium]
MESVFQDLRFSARTLIRTPGWTAIAVITLAIGTGANAAVFSFVDALLFRPAPGVQDGAHLVSVFTSDFSSGPYGRTSYPDFVSIRTGTDAFKDLAAIDASGAAALRFGEDVERVMVARVTGNYFALLGLRVRSGRPITNSDTEPSAAPVAVISDALWTRIFDADPSAVGRPVMLNGKPATIVGVAPMRFAGIDAGRPIDVWMPLIPPPDSPAERGTRALTVVGRLADGSNLGGAQAQLDIAAARLAREYPETNMGTLAQPREPRPMRVMTTTRIDPSARGAVLALSAVLMGGVGLVLLLACANVANLLLSRTTARSREIAVRRALGAGSRRLLRLLLTETLVLAVGAAILGLLFAAWTADVLPSFFPAEVAQALDVTPGDRVVIFALALATISAVLVGIGPAIRAVRPPLAQSLRGAAGDITERSASRIRKVLVGAQVGIACVLLITAALLVESVQNQLHMDPGFTTRNALVANVEVPPTIGEEAGERFFDAVLENVRTLPGVKDASWVRSLPLSGGSRRGFQPEGYVPRKGEDLELQANVAAPDYFQTMGIPFVDGRDFSKEDRESLSRTAIVNEALASQFFQGRAVGRHVTDSSGRLLEIVGVVRTGRFRTVTAKEPPTVYYPLAQEYSPGMTLVAHVSGPPQNAADGVRKAIRAVSADVPVFRMITLEDHIRESAAAERLSASLVSACGLLAVALAIVGLYGAVAYLVSRRTREIGVRIALGAEPRHVLMLVVGDGMRIALSGVGSGVVAAIALTRILRATLYGISATDATTYVSVATLLVVIAFAAAYVPARRAVRINPSRALAHS